MSRCFFHSGNKILVIFSHRVEEAIVDAEADLPVRFGVQDDRGGPFVLRWANHPPPVSFYIFSQTRVDERASPHVGVLPDRASSWFEIDLVFSLVCVYQRTVPHECM